MKHFFIHTFTICIHSQRFPNMHMMNFSGWRTRWGSTDDLCWDGVIVLLQQLVNITFRYWTCQHTVFRVSASGYISPADEYYWEYGVKLDDVCHRVKHLRRNKTWATVNTMLKRVLSFWIPPLTSFDRCPVPRAYLLVLSRNRIFTL